MWTLDFWMATIERGVKTFAQSWAASLIAAGTGIIDTDWVGVLSISAMAALVSILTSIGSGAVTGGPSLTSEMVTPLHRWTVDEDAKPWETDDE